MEIIRSARPFKNRAEVKVWQCNGCSVIHLSIGKTVVNFSREEFRSFTEAVVDLNYSDWGSTINERDVTELAGATVH